MLEFGSQDPSEVHNNSTLIFLDLLKIQLKYVHALQRAVVTEIQIRGNTLNKKVKHSVKTLTKLKAKMKNTTQEARKEEESKQELTQVINIVFLNVADEEISHDITSRD